jgi:hypothetical protein
MPRLIEDWRRVLRRAWSVRLIALAAVLSGLEIALPMLEGVVDIPRGILAGLSGLVTCAALVARLVAQREIGHGDR